MVYNLHSIGFQAMFYCCFYVFLPDIKTVLLVLGRDAAILHTIKRPVPVLLLYKICHTCLGDALKLLISLLFEQKFRFGLFK